MSIHKVRSRRRSGKRLSSRHVVHPAPGRKPSESCAKSVKAQKDRKEEHTVYIRKKEKKEKRREASPSRDDRSNCGRGARMRKNRLQRLVANRVRQSTSVNQARREKERKKEKNAFSLLLFSLLPFAFILFLRVHSLYMCVLF